MNREQAFSALSHFDRAAEWDPGVESAEMLTPEPVGLGSRFALAARFGGRTLPLVYEIVDYQHADRLVLRAENAFVRSVDTITFEDLSDHTAITYDARLVPKGVSRLAAPLFAVAFRRIGDRATAGLRAYLNRPER